MNQARLKFIVFDEACFPDAPVQMDDGAVSYYTVAGEIDEVPVVANAEPGLYSLFVSKDIAGGETFLSLGIHDHNGRKNCEARIALALLRTCQRTPRLPWQTPEEADHALEERYGLACLQALEGFLTEKPQAFFSYLGAFIAGLCDDEDEHAVIADDRRNRFISGHFGKH